MRLKYIILTILLFAIEVLIALFIDDNFIRPYIGDVIVVILLYTTFKIFITKTSILHPIYIFIFACFVEFLQYINIVKLLNVSNKVLKIIIGSSFDFKDILCYFVGTTLIAITIYVQSIYEKRNQL